MNAVGAQLVSCTENIDETPSGMLLHGIMSSIAEFYSQNLATEAKKGMRQKAKSGGTPGMVPFGYLNTRERSEDGREIRTVTLDPDRSHWVPWMYERYAEGNWTVAMLREELNSRGVCTLPRPNRPSRPIANSHIDSILKKRYYVGVVTFEGVEYPGKHPALITEQLFSEVQRVRSARHRSREKPRVHSHYLKGSVYCGECGEPLTFEQSRNRQGVLYDYFYCLGRQSYKNGCEFRAIQAHQLETLVDDHWSRVTLSEDAVAEIRRLVLDHLGAVLPENLATRQSATDKLQKLERKTQKLMDAFYADALDVHDLKREQGRIATERAAVEVHLSKLDINEQIITRNLDSCLHLLASAHQHYLQSDHTSRRDLNQSVFEHLYVHDDEVVASDLTPAFRRLISDSLGSDLESERKGDQIEHVKTMDLYLVPEVSVGPDRGHGEHSMDLPARTRRRSPDARLGGFLGIERPGGRLPWERKNPGPVKDRGSKELLLVAGTGFERVTSGQDRRPISTSQVGNVELVVLSRRNLACWSPLHRIVSEHVPLVCGR